MKPKNSADYQTVLRAIGQGIEKLGVESVDLEISDNHEFVVSGIYKETTPASTLKPRVKTSFLSLIINAAKNNDKRKTDPALFHFKGIRFTQNNIDLLDRAGKASRSRRDGNPQNPLGIAHVLRMAGAYLDHKAAGSRAFSGITEGLHFGILTKRAAKRRKYLLQKTCMTIGFITSKHVNHTMH
jgi:hypothetical protein